MVSLFYVQIYIFIQCRFQISIFYCHPFAQSYCPIMELVGSDHFLSFTKNAMLLVSPVTLVCSTFGFDNQDITFPLFKLFSITLYVNIFSTFVSVMLFWRIKFIDNNLLFCDVIAICEKSFYHQIIHIKVKPIYDVEKEKQEGAGNEEETINVGIFVRPCRVLFFHCGFPLLPMFPLQTGMEKRLLYC